MEGNKTKYRLRFLLQKTDEDRVKAVAVGDAGERTDGEMIGRTDKKRQSPK